MGKINVLNIFVYEVTNCKSIHDLSNCIPITTKISTCVIKFI